MATKACNASFLLGANVIAELTSITNTITGETLDVTTFDSGCTKEFIQGLVSGQVTMDGFYDPTDTNGQKALLTAQLAGNNVSDPKFLTDGVNGFEAEEAVVTSTAVGATVGGLVSFNASLQLSGTISVV